MSQPPSRLRARLHHLYYGTTSDCRRFRYAVLAFDMTTMLFVIGTSFIPRATWIGVVDVLIGFVLAFVLAAVPAGGPST